MTATVLPFPTPAPSAERDDNEFARAFLAELADDARLDAVTKWAMAGFPHDVARCAPPRPGMVRHGRS